MYIDFKKIRISKYRYNYTTLSILKRFDLFQPIPESTRSIHIIFISIYLYMNYNNTIFISAPVFWHKLHFAEIKQPIGKSLHHRLALAHHQKVRAIVVLLNG